jgi:uncharacterized protein (UPF0303 family)
MKPCHFPRAVEKEPDNDNWIRRELSISFNLDSGSGRVGCWLVVGFLEKSLTLDLMVMTMMIIIVRKVDV